MINQPLQLAHEQMTQALNEYMVGIDYLATAQPSPETTNTIAHTRAVFHRFVEWAKVLLHEAEKTPYEAKP